jgi:predicted MPP superfamily phosphohydrolase
LWEEENILKMKKNRIIFGVFVIVFIIIIIVGLNNQLTINEYNIHSNKIETSIKIVLLADLHSCSYGKSQQQLIEAISKQNPDIILMSGDIADDMLPDDKVKELLNGISYKYPCYYVSGNHEFWSNRIEVQKEMFRSYGVNVLEGTYDSISLNGENITICGVDDPNVGLEKFESQLDNVAKFITKEKYTILLAHRPELINRYSDYNFDLVLSGHAHGGQWRIPFILPKGLYAPNQGFFPKYTYGIYEYNNIKMLVSRGLSRESTHIPRFFNPPELVVINLLP